MNFFDQEAAHESLRALDDSKAKLLFEQTGLSNYSEELEDSGLIPLFTPFFLFMQAKKADDVPQITEEQLMDMAANLNELADVLERGVNHCDLMRNLEQVRSERRRIL